MNSVGRNDPCPCGSGKKYKKCCQAKDEASELAALEKKHSEAQKAFEKAKAKEQAAASAKGAASPGVSGRAVPAPLKEQEPGAAPPKRPATQGAAEAKHSTRTVPKFNMPRRIAGR
jgi:hypothetical protein